MLKLVHISWLINILIVCSVGKDYSENLVQFTVPTKRNVGKGYLPLWTNALYALKNFV